MHAELSQLLTKNVHVIKKTHKPLYLHRNSGIQHNFNEKNICVIRLDVFPTELESVMICGVYWADRQLNIGVFK